MSIWKRSFWSWPLLRRIYGFWWMRTPAYKAAQQAVLDPKIMNRLSRVSDAFDVYMARAGAFILFQVSSVLVRNGLGEVELSVLIQFSDPLHRPLLAFLLPIAGFDPQHPEEDPILYVLYTSEPDQNDLWLVARFSNLEYFLDRALEYFTGPEAEAVLAALKTQG